MEKKWNGKGYNKNGIMQFEINNGKGLIKEYYDNDEIEIYKKSLNIKVKEDLNTARLNLFEKKKKSF